MATSVGASSNSGALSCSCQTLERKILEVESHAVRYTGYSEDIEHAMKTFCASLSEHDRRGYAAIEAFKLGHGGIGYIADLLGCSERTVRRGLAELQNAPPRLPLGRSRKKGAAANAASTA
jgi:hypothetical protein